MCYIKAAQVGCSNVVFSSGSFIATFLTLFYLSMCVSKYQTFYFYKFEDPPRSEDFRVCIFEFCCKSDF